MGPVESIRFTTLMKYLDLVKLIHDLKPKLNDPDPCLTHRPK